MTRELLKLQNTAFEREHGFCSDRQRPYMRDFFRRLLRNDIDDYFYLEPEPDVGIADPMVAFLSLSIPIKADLHYEACMEARTLQLSQEFSTKLGWLIGNMFSRVGTKDWVPAALTEDKFEERLTRELDDLCVWLPPSDIKGLKKAADKGEITFGSDGRLDEATVADLKARSEEAQRSQRLKLANLSTKIVEDCLPENSISQKQRDKILARLASDPDLGVMLKR